MKFAKGVVSVLHKIKKIEKPGICGVFFFDCEIYLACPRSDIVRVGKNSHCHYPEYLCPLSRIFVSIIQNICVIIRNIWVIIRNICVIIQNICCHSFYQTKLIAIISCLYLRQILNEIAQIYLFGILQGDPNPKLQSYLVVTLEISIFDRSLEQPKYVSRVADSFQYLSETHFDLHNLWFSLACILHSCGDIAI